MLTRWKDIETRWSRALLVGILVAALQPAQAWAQDLGAPAEAVLKTEMETAGEEPWSRGIERDVRVQARELFGEGNQLLIEGLFAQAASKYEEALHLWPHPAIYFNLAIAQINLVQLIAAYESLERAIAYGPAPLVKEKRYQQAVDNHARLKSQLSVIEVTCETDGAEVLLDGELLFTAPGRATKIVLPGPHLLVARKQGLNAETQQAVVSAGERRTYHLVWRQVVIERYMPAWIPWTLMTAGGFLLSGAGYLDAQSSRDLDRYDRDFATQCSTGCTEQEKPELVSGIRNAEQSKKAAVGLYAVGGAAFVAGAVLVYLNRERVVLREERRRAMTVTPLLLPRGVGVGAVVRFQ